MRNTKPRAHAALLILLAFIVGGAASCDQPPDTIALGDSGAVACVGAQDANALLHLTTDQGDIVINFFADAAPQSVTAVKNLVCFGTVEPAADAAVVEHGYYDNLEFDHTHPNVELRLAKGARDDIRIPKEINANSLGLDKQVIETQGEAMDMFQFVIHKEYAKNKNPDAHGAQLLEWISKFRVKNDPGFLIGKSRKQINEALGYPYIETVESQPVQRGSVLLQPETKTHSGPRLVIALAELGDYSGKWTVIGEVVDGLDLAESIAKAPSTGRMHPRWRPLNPVAVVKAEMVFDRTR